MTTLEEAFEQFKKLPDWDRYPMPEVFYQHFQVKKPQPGSVMECISYQPPPYASEGNGKVEIRGPVEGGVREIKDLMTLPVEVKRLNEETNELEEYPIVKPMSEEERIMEMVKEAITNKMNENKSVSLQDGMHRTLSGTILTEYFKSGDTESSIRGDTEGIGESASTDQ